MKKTETIIQADGTKSTQDKNLKRLLNLNYLKYGNKTFSSGCLNYPEIYCNTRIYPDYLALYSEPGLYYKTSNTGVCFNLYDNEFDGKNGLFNAIYYDDVSRLKFFKNRFQGIRFFIGPDCSQLDDVHKIESYYRVFRQRIMLLWSLFEIDAIAVPQILFPSLKCLSITLDGLQGSSVVAFSTKGYIDNPTERGIMKEAVKITANSLQLHAIIVYDVCASNELAMEIFQYASDKGIKIIIPANTLKIRNQNKAEGKKYAEQ